MKYLKLFEYYNQLESKLAKYNIENYTINKDNTIDVNGHVDLYKRNLTQIPFQFGTVEGSFSCSGNQLTSLKGAPEYVGGYFSCGYNQLTNLEYAPKYVGGIFYCHNNDIRYIQSNIEIEGDFNIYDNPIDIIFYINKILNKQILEELAIYNPISKDGLTVYKTKLKDMYKQLGIINRFDDDINSLSNNYKIV